MVIDRALLAASRRSWLNMSSDPVGPVWMQWLWTVLFCAALAVPFTVMGFFAFSRNSPGAWHDLAGWAALYGRNFIVCMTIGALIHGVFDLLSWLMGGMSRVRRWPAWKRTLYFSGVPLLCTFIGWPIGVTFAGASLLDMMRGTRGQNGIVASVLLALLMVFLFHQFFAMKSRQIEAEKRAAEAQLRLLQGQIEPHFLFNTLAGVLSLIDHDPAKAKLMLHDFTEYLRSTLATLRSGEVPLAQELELAENYLRLLGSRMEDRLRWQIDADHAARQVPVPPLLLQPLVENAIHHGLEPQVQGGSVMVRAHVQGGELVIEVQDDGRGLAAWPASPRPGARKGQGLALANVRGRLLSRYGTRASLDLQATNPGTRAVMRLPVDPDPSLRTPGVTR